MADQEPDQGEAVTMEIKVVQPAAAEQTYAIDGTTAAKDLLSTVAEQPGFADTFTMAATGAVLIAFDGSMAQRAEEFIREVGDATVAEAFAGCAVSIHLPPKAVGKEQLKLLSSNGETLPALVVPSPCTFKDLSDGLSALFEGAELSQTELCTPAKTGVARFKLSVFDPNSEVVASVSEKVVALPPFKRPAAPPEALGELHLQLPQEAVARAVAPQDAVAELAAYQEKKLKQMLHDIATSKSGDSADRAFVKALAEQANITFTLASGDNQPSKQGDATGYVHCGLCCVHLTFGKASCGVLKHCCGKDHVAKWLPLAAIPGLTIEGAREKCGTVWGSGRNELTTQAKAAKGEKARRAHTQCVAQHIAVAMAAGAAPIGTPPRFGPLTPGGVAALAPQAGMPVAAPATAAATMAAADATANQLAQM